MCRGFRDDGEKEQSEADEPSGESSHVPVLPPSTQPQVRLGNGLRGRLNDPEPLSVYRRDKGSPKHNREREANRSEQRQAEGGT